MHSFNKYFLRAYTCKAMFCNKSLRLSTEPPALVSSFPKPPPHCSPNPKLSPTGVPQTPEFWFRNSHLGPRPLREPLFQALSSSCKS